MIFHRQRFVFASVAICLAVLGGGKLANAETVAHSQPIAIVGARVLLKPGTTLPEATVIIVDGAIAAVGPACLHSPGPAPSTAPGAWSRLALSTRTARWA
ncbi:MAG: hypothetical protein IPL79_16825 [Myxococcales bacterium]|nr:hypothetical protein [Myxococcales bacterium]